MLETARRRGVLRYLDHAAIFLLIATCGLRASEIVSLTLDDVEWRARRLRIRQRKTGGVLWLPLTDEVATTLLDYLREGRPQLAVRRYRRGFQTESRPYREVFLRCHTPAGVQQAVAMKISGHRDASVFQRYNIVDLEQTTDAMQRVQRLSPIKVRHALPVRSGRRGGGR